MTRVCFRFFCVIFRFDKLTNKYQLTVDSSQSVNSELVKFVSKTVLSNVDKFCDIFHI